jgi:hypothetical protein
MNDDELVARINELAEEEHRLERSHQDTGLTDDDLRRLRGLEVALDQCWDLLRQRRARREFGQDPDNVSARPEGTVEGYEQ